MVIGHGMVILSPVIFLLVYGRKYIFNNVCFNNLNVVHTSGVTNKDKVHTPDSTKPNL